MAALRVAVTGASGFVGGYLARDLEAQGHTVISYGRRAAGALAFPLEDYRQWDITRGPIAAPVVDAVVHCAAQVGDWGSERAYHRANVEGTRAVLAGFPGARMVYVSTSSVYSDGVARANIREDAPTGNCAHSAYARTKAQAERLVLASASDAVVLRPHIVYGPGDTTLLPRLLASRRLGWLFIPGTGAARLSVTHVGNLALAVVAALHHPRAAGAFNVSDADTIAVDELLRTVLARTGSTARIAYLPAPLARALATGCETLWSLGRLPSSPPLTRYVVDQLSAEHTLDISRAREQMAYAPRFSLPDGVM